MALSCGPDPGSPARGLTEPTQLISLLPLVPTLSRNALEAHMFRRSSNHLVAVVLAQQFITLVCLQAELLVLLVGGLRGGYCRFGGLLYGV